MLFQVELVCALLVANGTHKLGFNSAFKLLVAMERPPHAISLAAPMTRMHHPSRNVAGRLHQRHTHRSLTTAAVAIEVVVVVIHVVVATIERVAQVEDGFEIGFDVSVVDGTDRGKVQGHKLLGSRRVRQGPVRQSSGQEFKATHWLVVA